jgi:DNA-binding PadR family transcriptional regulator
MAKSSSTPSRTKRPRLTVADLVVLSLIAEGPRHGYAVYAELQRRQVEEWAPVSRAQIYYSLEKLAAGGHIVSARDPDSALGPERAVYRLSAAGTRSLRAALAEPDWASRRAPAPFLTWVLLAWYAEPAARAAVLAERARYLDEQIAHERATLAAIRRDDPHATTPLLVVELIEAQYALERAWLDRLAEDKWMVSGSDAVTDLRGSDARTPRRPARAP